MLPAAPWRAMVTGAAWDVDLIAGYTRNEYRLFGVIDLDPERLETTR